MTFWQNIAIVLIGGSGMALSLRLCLSRLLTFSLSHPVQTEALARALLGLMQDTPAATPPAPGAPLPPPAA